MSERNPEEALEDIREEIAEGDEPSEGEREFLESERVELDRDADDGGNPLV